MLYCKSSGRRLLQHELARVACDSWDSRNMRLRESCATLVKFDEILPLIIDQDQVLTTWSEGRENGLVLNLRLCDVTALQASKSDINIQ